MKSEPQASPPSRSSYLISRYLVPVLAFVLGDLFFVGAALWWFQPAGLSQNRVSPPPAELAEAQFMRLATAGSFATGNQPGDRVLVIDPEGGVKLQILGLHKEVFQEQKLAYECVRLGAASCLLLKDGSLIEVQNRDTLSYWSDIYLRTQ